MRVAIVGTSNSVVSKGWARALEPVFPSDWTLENLSIGGSASLYGSFAVDTEKVAQNYDFCLLDFAINDQQMIDSGHMTPEYVAASFGALLRHFAEPEAHCTPVVIIIPQRDLVAHNRQDHTYNITVKLCERYGVSYFDLYAALRRIGQENEVDYKGCFSDWTYLQPFAQDALAQAMLKQLQGLRPNRRPSEQLLREAPRCYALQGDDIELSSEIRQEVGSSLARKEVRTIGVGTSGTIRSVEYLCGIIHWIDPESGALCFDGDGQKVKKGLRKEWTRMFALTLFKAPVKAVESTIRFQFGDLEDYVFERTFGMTPTTPIDGSRADLIGFVGCGEDPVAAGRRLLAAVGGAPKHPHPARQHWTPKRFLASSYLTGWEIDGERLVCRRLMFPRCRYLSPLW